MSSTFLSFYYFFFVPLLWNEHENCLNADRLSFAVSTVCYPHKLFWLLWSFKKQNKNNSTNYNVQSVWNKDKLNCYAANKITNFELSNSQLQWKQSKNVYGKTSIISISHGILWYYQLNFVWKCLPVIILMYDSSRHFLVRFHLYFTFECVWRLSKICVKRTKEREKEK